MALKEPTVFPVCTKCGKPLTDLRVEFSGVDHWDWDEAVEQYRLCVPEARYEDPEKHLCGHCGQPITDEQEEFFEEHKG